MARSSGRYSKFPKVNRDISVDGGPEVATRPGSLTGDEIKALLAASRKNSGLVFIPDKMSFDPEPDVDEAVDSFTEALIAHLVEPLTQEEIDRPASHLMVTIMRAPEEVHPPERADVEAPNTIELSIPKVMAWVDGDKSRASLALATEERQENPRVTLVAKLKELLAD